MKLKLYGMAEEIEHRTRHLLHRQEKIDVIADVLCLLLKPMEQHLDCMETASFKLNQHTNSVWVGRRIDWGII